MPTLDFGPYNTRDGFMGSSMESNIDPIYELFDMPTPPTSVTDSPAPLTNATHVPVSTTFYPNAPVDSAPSDVLVVTADGVWFYLHFHRLQGASTNGFGGHIPTLTAEPVYVCEQSTILNLVVHTIYGLPFTQFIPSFVNLFEAVDVLDRYGALQSDIMKPGKPLYEVLVTHACAGRAFDVYALAAHYNLEELAVSSSLYLHGFCLSLLTDEDAERIGPVYLRRLFFLHLGRSDALKRLLLTGPTGHPSTTSCNVAAQTSVTRAWALAAAYLSWEARADVSPSQLSSAFSSLEAGLPCMQCRTALKERVKQLLLQWSLVKQTI